GNAFVQRMVLGRLASRQKASSYEHQAMETYVARPGDSLSLIAGYPNSGWEERLDQLIAANQDHPDMKKRTPDDPQYGWLEGGGVVHTRWLTSGTPLPSAPAPSMPLHPGTAPAPPAVGKSRCSVAITGVTKIGITKQFQLTATGLPGGTRGGYTWSV